MVPNYVTSHATKITAELGNEASWCLQLHQYQDVIVFQPSMELEREQLELLGAVSHLKRIFAWLFHAPSLKQIERYVVLLYQQTSALIYEDEARKQLFTQNHMIENIPPTWNSMRKGLFIRQGTSWESELYETLKFHHPI